MADLRLYEEITLLALNDRTGRLRGDHPRHRIAGAILTGLMIRHTVSIDREEKTIKAGDASTLDDAILRKAHDVISGSEGGQISIADFIGHLAAENTVIDEIAEGLCDKGILRTETSKVLWFFETTSYPEVDPTAEDAIKQRMKDVISGAIKGDERTYALIALAGTYGLLNLNLGNEFVKAHKERIDAIVSGDIVADATKDLIDAIDAMIIMSAVIPAVIITAY